MLGIKAILFAIVLFNVAEVPVQHGISVYMAADRHGIDPIEFGAVLIAENRGRRYHPFTVGRHGSGGEFGLYQLHPGTWGSFCRKQLKAEGKEVGYLINNYGLFDAKLNIDCAARVIKELERYHQHSCTRGRTPLDPSWIHHYRCGASIEARNGAACMASVNRVLAIESDLRSIGDAQYFILAVYLFVPSTRLYLKELQASKDVRHITKLLDSPREMRQKMQQVEKEIAARKLQRAEAAKSLAYQRELNAAQERGLVD